MEEIERERTFFNPYIREHFYFMKKGILIAAGALLMLASCQSEEERMAEHMCECIEKPSSEFKECMGEDYNKLEEYDHSDKEESFMKTKKTTNNWQQ